MALVHAKHPLRLGVALVLKSLHTAHFSPQGTRVRCLQNSLSTFIKVLWLCKQAVEKKLDEAQNDTLDQSLAQRAKAAQGKKAATSVQKAPLEMQDTDAAQAAKFL